MKIRTQFILSTALFGIILSFIAVSAFINDQRMQQSDQQQEIARSIEQEANELSFLTNDYLLYRESLQLAQWESKSAALSSDLSNLKTAIPEQQVLVSNIKSNHQQLQSVFNEVKSSLGQGASDLPFLQITWSRLKVQSQGMIFDASRLVQLLHEGENQLRQTTSQLIFAMTGVFGAFLLVNYLLTNIRTLKALSNLQAGTRIIGSGNLNFTMLESGHDEIGELTRAFNQMTTDLREVTASKADLEREATARKHAEEESRKAADDWEATFNAIPDFVTIQDKNHCVVRANKAVATAMGVSISDIVSKTCYSLVHGTNEPWPDCPHTLAMEKKEPITREFYEPHLGKHVEVTCSPLFEENGEVSGTVHVVRDITERKEAEEALRTALAVTNEQWEELSAVAEALRAIIEKATFKDAAFSIFNICKRMTGATAGYVALLSQDGKENQVLFLDSGGISCTVNENLPMPIRGLREKAYQTNKAVYENDFRNSEWVKYMPSGHAILNNVLFAPLVIDGKAAGLIGLANKTGGFNEYDLKIATAMGEYASIGLKNSNLLEAITESERRYRQLIETTTEGVWIASPEGKTIYVNKRMADMLGSTVEEVTAKKRDDFFDPEYVPVAMKIRAERARGIAGSYELKLRRKDGSPLWVLVSGSPVYDKDGKHIGNLGMHKDITDRKQAEEALRDSERKYRQLIETATEGIWLVDTAGVTTYVNQRMADILGSTADELIGKKRDDFINSEYLSYMDEIRRGRATGVSSHYEMKMRRKDGSPWWALISGSPIFDEAGLHIGNLGMHTDITDRKLSEEALKESEGRYRNIVETANEGILVTAPDGKIIYVNQQLTDILGYSHAEMTAKSGIDFVDEEDKPTILNARRELKAGAKMQLELRFRRKNGTLVWTLANTSPILDEKRQHTGNLTMYTDITTRKQAEEALQKLNDELEERVTERTGELETANFNLKAEIAAREMAQERIRYLATFPELNPSIIIEMDEDGKVTYANPAAKHELYNIENVGALHPYLRDFQKLFEEARQRNAPFARELQIKDKSYEQIIHYLPETRRLRIFGRDITRRKRAEKELRDASLYARSLIEASLDPLITISREGKIMDANKATELATGVPREKLIGSDFSDYFAEPEKAKAGYEEVFSQGSVWDYPLTLRHTSGNTMDVLYNASVYRDEEGEVLGVFAAARDITERKKLEEELRDASLYARSLIEASLDSLVTISRDGKITDANKATELITGVAREKLVDTDFFNSFTEPEKARDGYQQVFAMGFVRDFPLTVRHLSGKTTDVLYNAGIYRNEDGEMEGVLATARDITERKKLETELRRSNNELQQFAYITSHDLQEPLRMITSYLQLIERRYKNNLDKDADEFIGYAVDGAARLRNMINDLLEYSRIETRGKPFQPTSSETALEAALDNLKIAIQENKAIVTHELLPVMTADPAQLIQLFQNLIGNGVKFHGSEPPRVHVSAKKESNEWVFTVKDNGIGIDPQYFDRIFHVFQRLHTRDEYPGTGIGLALAKRIVERHKGRIWVESGDGKGAKFYFTIPV